MDPTNEPQNNGYESVTKRMTSNEIKLGNKLLVYISCCLAGRAYPYGDIPNDMIAKVKYDVYTCLTTIHTKRLRFSEIMRCKQLAILFPNLAYFPHIRHLNRNLPR